MHRLRGQVLMFDAADLCEILLEIERDALANCLQSCRERWAEAAKQFRLPAPINFPTLHRFGCMRKTQRDIAAHITTNCFS